MFGKPISDEQRFLMTELVKDVRKILKSSGSLKSGAKLVVHTPDSFDYCFEVGLDVREWMKAGVIDGVVGGGDFRLRPWRELVTECRKYAVAAFAGLSTPRLQDHRQWRLEAIEAWDAGVDGVATFNMFRPGSNLLQFLDKPKLMKTMPSIKRYKLEPDQAKKIGSLATLLKGGEKHLHPELRERWINPPKGI